MARENEGGSLPFPQKLKGSGLIPCKQDWWTCDAACFLLHVSISHFHFYTCGVGYAASSCSVSQLTPPPPEPLLTLLGTTFSMQDEARWVY